MKRIFCILLSISVIFGCFCINALSASMTLKNETYPTELVKGSTFSAYGEITSNYDILRVEISVTNSSGKTAFSYIGNPGEKTYDIHNVDYLLTFSKLDLGTYTYKITATDTQSSNVVLLSKQFKVVSTLTPTKLKLTDATYPESFAQGKTFSVYGTVTSDYKITSVTCSVYTSGGTLQFTKTAYPDTYSYSVHNIDSYMTFSKLAAGSYVYKITASDTKTKDVELLSKSFQVMSDTPVVSSALTLSDGNYPAVLTVGEAFSVKGTIKSDYTITDVSIGVYNSNGTSRFSYSGKPNAKSFDVHSVDSLMTFSKLPSGTYTYIISASDTKTKNIVLLQKSFTVTNQGSAEAGLKQVNWNVIDLSYWNEITSWDKIAQSVDGVILRIGYRATVSRAMSMDSTFLSSYKEATARGMHIGCYFFSAALTEAEAREEADFVMKMIKDNKLKFDMPIYFDIETDEQAELTQQECTDISRAFCDRLKANGYYTGIYSYKYFLRDELYASKLSDYTIWVAQYGNQCTYEGAYGMWQYSETGQVSGLYGAVDMNRCYYDFPDYIKSKGLNGYTVTPVVETKYDFVIKNSIKVDKINKIVSGVAPKITSANFLSTYITHSSDVTVGFSNTVGGNVATGTVITFKKSDKVLDAYTVSVAGDVDKNSIANSADALMTLECSIGKRTLSGVAKLSADINSDGVINSSDALGILQYAVEH